MLSVIYACASVAGWFAVVNTPSASGPCVPEGFLPLLLKRLVWAVHMTSGGIVGVSNAHVGKRTSVVSACGSVEVIAPLEMSAKKGVVRFLLVR